MRMTGLASLAALALAGCAPHDGIVTDSYRNSDGKNWTVCAKLDGEKGCDVMLSVSDGPRCKVGEVYPGCLKGDRR